MTRRPPIGPHLEGGPRGVRGGVEPLTLGELAGVGFGAVALGLIAATALQPFGSIGVVLVPLIAFVGPTLVVARLRGGPVRVLGLIRPTMRGVVGAVLIGGSMWMLLILALGPLLEQMPDHAVTEQNLAPLIDPDIALPVRLLVFALVPAFTEELLCRGLLCRHLAARLGPVAGVLLSALYFAALHLSLTQGLPAIVTGVALGVVALRSRSTITAIVLHAIHNACILLAASPDLAVGDVLVAGAAWSVPLALTATVIGFWLMREIDSPAESLP